MGESDIPFCLLPTEMPCPPTYPCPCRRRQTHAVVVKPMPSSDPVVKNPCHAVRPSTMQCDVQRASFSPPPRRGEETASDEKSRKPPASLPRTEWAVLPRRNANRNVTVVTQAHARRSKHDRNAPCVLASLPHPPPLSGYAGQGWPTAPKRRAPTPGAPLRRSAACRFTAAAAAAAAIVVTAGADPPPPPQAPQRQTWQIRRARSAAPAGPSRRAARSAPRADGCRP